MKTYVTTILLSTLCFNSICAQDKLENDFNRWSVEVNIGQNKAIKPFATGYYSADPSKAFNFSGVNHYTIGVRYMFSNFFGLKADYARDQFTNLKNAGSLPFDTQQNRFGLQGVLNLGHLLRFESFTNRIGILAHAGIHVSQFNVNQGSNKGISENNGGIMFGITPQVRLAKWVALTADFTVVNNVRQHLNWDGSTSSANENLSGTLYNTTLGLTFYLGKKDKHADWYTDADALSTLEGTDLDARKRLDEIETLMNDTDRDGVPDYLDVENNTPGGVAVDTRGRFIDKNNNGTPDELEPQNSNGEFTSIPLKKEDAIKALVEKGYVNVFFDVNKDDPNAGSTNNVYHIINFLRNYPDAKAKLVGYADVRGNESKNKELSQRRAQRVYNIIVACGINANRVSIESQGVDASYPADSKIGLDLARRVSVIIE
ncbi:OmpA family protein [Flavobacterium sp.]|uniref:OmpA family protein n=1 Tax=Flavobacterium sp. TaxID=239 RepID=UPI0035AF5423